MSTPDKEYEPFGEEWKKEMSKFPKGQLIEMLATAHKARVELTETLKQIRNDQSTKRTI